MSRSSSIVFRFAGTHWLNTESVLFEPSDSADGLDAVLRLVAQSPGASVEPLYAAPTENRLATEKWALAVPSTAWTKSHSSGAWLGTSHIVKLASSSEADRVLAMLKSDPRVEASRTGDYQSMTFIDQRPSRKIANVFEKFILAPLGIPFHDQWPLDNCGFSDYVWNTYDRECPEDPLIMIDCGDGGLGHPELTNRVVSVTPPKGRGSSAVHAGAVAGVIAARRDDVVNDAGLGMRGYCSASLDVYNIWESTGEPDCQALYDVLKSLATTRCRLVNVSLGTPTADVALNDGVAMCIEAGHTIVAAAGDVPAGSDIRTKFYPAACENVIAVGSCDPHGNKIDGSVEGTHIHLGAPGTSIYSVNGDKDYWAGYSGTSFAAAAVSSAIWLARRKVPNLSRQRAADKLAASANRAKLGGKERTDGHGFGKLDVAKFLECV